MIEITTCPESSFQVGSIFLIIFFFKSWPCTGCIFVHPNTYPLDDKTQPILCGISSIMFGIKLVEGKNDGKELYEVSL